MPSPFQNTILAALAPAEAARLTERGKLIDLVFGEELHQPGDTVEHVHFPEAGLVSLIVTTEEGRGTETGMVGFEGAVGLVEACGSGVLYPRAAVQVAGRAWRVRAADCRTLSDESGAFRKAVWSRLEFQMIEARQSATCRSFHPVEARLARWLLESRDRGKADGVLNVTHEFMAAMLGVQRSTVSAFTPELQKKGLIRYSRGKVELLDIAGLETLACECREVLVNERERVTATEAALA